MAPSLTDGPFDRMADSEDLHLLQALRRTADHLGQRPADDEVEGTARLRATVRGLLDDLGSSGDRPGRPEAMGDRHERMYRVDPELVNRARAGLMAFYDRPTSETAGLAADAVDAVALARRT